MQTLTRAITTERSTVSLMTLAIIFGLFTLAMESAFHIPVKLPGHRAFVGALALLTFAEAFAPVMLIGFAGMISAILVLGMNAHPLTAVVWVSAAIVIWLLGKTRRTRVRSHAYTAAYFLLCGLLFGLFRYLAMMKGFHHTPEVIRMAGHLGFGSFAGLISFGATRLTSAKTR